MGDTTGEADETPVHTVALPTFWIGEKEVTNAQFARFLEATDYQGLELDRLTGKPIQKENGHYQVIPEKANFPVMGMPWKAALAYCQWAHLRLPSEAEWEKAARGEQARRYPWGNTWEPDNCLWGENREEWQNFSVETGSFPKGASPYGCLDMAGSAWEWCSSKYADYPYDAADGREDLSDLLCARVIRGGSGIDHPSHLRSSNRFRLYPQATLDWRFEATTGFRVARDEAESPGSPGPSVNSAPLRRRPAPYFQMLTSKNPPSPEQLDGKFRLQSGPHRSGEILGYPREHEREMRYFVPIEHFLGLSSEDRREGFFDLDRFLHIQPGQIVADVGAGSGVFLTYLSESVGPTGQVWATEISPSALACIQAWLSPPPAPGNPDDLYYFLRQVPSPEAPTYLVLHDVSDCLLPPGSLDMACLIHVHFFHYPHAQAGVSPARPQVIGFYRSLARSLKPSGKLVILDWSEFNPSHDPAHGILTAAEVEDQMKEAGFHREARWELNPTQDGYQEIDAQQKSKDIRKRNTLFVFGLKTQARTQHPSPKEAHQQHPSRDPRR